MGTNAMKAFVMRRLGEAGVMDKPIPEPGANEAVIRTTCALVCTSDVHTVKGAIPVEPNVTLGHEAVGVVHALGSAVEGIDVGQRVAVGSTTPCFQCDYGQRRFTSQCGGMLGGYKVHRPARWEHGPVFRRQQRAGQCGPDPGGAVGSPGVYATDMLSTGFMGAERAELQLGETVAVFAQGAVGLSATIGCRLLGAGLIIAVESVPRRQELSRQFGADVIVDLHPGRCC